MIFHDRSSLKNAVNAGRARGGRSAFTMLELLLVLTVIAILAALSWPRMTAILQQQQIQGSAEQVRQLLDRARVRAVEEGQTLQVRFEPGGRNYVILPQAPYTQQTNQTNRYAAVGLTKGNETTKAISADPFRVYQLPEGVSFYVQQGIQGLHTGDSPIYERLGDEWMAHLQNGAIAREVVWTAPILFYPDGSATDGLTALVDDKGRMIQVSVRGLTGTVYAGKVKLAENAMGGTR